MSNSFRFWEEQTFDDNSKEEISENVKNIVDLISMLTLEEKIKVKKIVKNLEVFN